MKHPNRVPFAGVLTIVDEPSDQPPAGSRGHRIILTHKAASKALPGLIGMAINYKTTWSGHDSRQKVGVIESAELDGRELHVAGYIFGLDFPEVVEAATKGWTKDALGMSYELHDSHVADMRRKIWTVTRTTFTGAAVLLRAKAAYRRTFFVVNEESAVSSLAAGADRVARRVDDPKEECGEEEGCEVCGFA